MVINLILIHILSLMNLFLLGYLKNGYSFKYSKLIMVNFNYREGILDNSPSSGWLTANLRGQLFSSNDDLEDLASCTTYLNVLGKCHFICKVEKSLKHNILI